MTALYARMVRTEDDGAWDALALTEYVVGRLERGWAEEGVGTVHLDEDHYVQWAADAGDLHIEVVSNAYLPPDRQLGFVHRRALQELRWNRPDKR